MPRGSANFKTADIVAIREACASGLTINELAARYAVDRSTIANIVKGVSWQSAGGPIQPPHTGPRSNTGYWGVTANGAGNRFSVVIRHEGRQVSLGVWKDVVDAARHYDAVARELGYPPERLNFSAVEPVTAEH